MKYLAPRKGRVAFAVALSIVMSGLVLAPTIITQRVIDDYIVTDKPDLSGIWLLMGFIAFAQAAVFILEALSTYLIQLTGQESMRDLRMDLFNHLQKQPLKFFDKTPVGYLVTRMTSDVNVLNELFSQGIIGIFQQLFMLIGIIIVLFIYNPWLALCTMIVVPMVLVLSHYFRKSIKTSYRLTRARLSQLNTHVQENVTGMRTVQANTRETRQRNKFLALNDSYRDAHYRTVFAYSTYFPLIEVIGAIGIAVIVWQGGRLYQMEGITIGELVLFVGLLERFFHPIRDLSEKFNLVQAALVAAERLFGLLDTEPEIVDPEQPIESIGFGKTIEFKDVWFAYNDEDWVLKGVSFKVERGQSVAIVGPTGSGKTTLMSLLCRFYDIQKGEILIDGVDIRKMTQSALREKIAIVLQEGFLFKGTVSENIRLGETSIPDDRIRDVAAAVNAAPFIERLPNKYDSSVKERGATFSVGQKQLLAFARALAFEPEILILDEATSNIDTETEQLVQDALHRLTSGRTSMIIAHRLSTIQNSDKILVLHHGHLAEEGNHQQLLKQDGLYRRLYELQYSDQAQANA